MPSLNDILTADYTHADAAFALQHGNLSLFLKNMNRKGIRYYPRKISTGPGGGSFRYGHILEIALHLAVGAYRSGHIARAVVGGLDRLLTGNDFALKTINAFPDDERRAIIVRKAEYQVADWPMDSETGRPIAPIGNTLLLDHPEFVLTEGAISRSATAPTFLIYNPAISEQHITTQVALTSDMSLSEAQSAVIALRTQNGTVDYTNSVIEDCDDLPVLNLTSLMVRLERRLAVRLEANQITDFRR